VTVRGAFGHNVDVRGYRFGIDQSAADRLRLVATAYDPVSRPFLAAHALPRPKVAVDLGCGPGFTTELLHEVCRPETTIGLDASGAFVAAARVRLPEVRFEAHDVTALPLPGAPANLIYARLLLAHLAEPKAVAQSWRSQLAPGGRLLIEDLEGVVNPPGPLHEYEDVSAAIVRSGGGLMYAGAELSDLGGAVTPVTVPGALAARIYLFNVRHWLHTPQLPVADVQLRDLEEGLVETSNGDHGSSVSWNVRQLVLSR
jgi:trans-aconitate 2-methyltransferase